MPEPAVDRTLLPVWDQCAIRAYIQLAFCFPFDNEDSQKKKEAAIEHIRDALGRLARQHPEFAAGVSADEQGRVWLEQRPEQDSIPFELRNLPDSTKLTGDTNALTSFTKYDELKHKGFPPAAFTHPDLAISGALEPGGESRPITQIQISFVEGGMILWINAHHSLIDGDSARLLLQCFAAQTRGVELEYPIDVAPAAMQRLEEGNETAEVLEPKDTGEQETPTDFAKILRPFPEYADLPDRSGPLAVRPSSQIGLPYDQSDHAQQRRVERILVFRQETIRRLSREIASAASWKPHSVNGRPPSTYLSLAALTWAHITKARLKVLEDRGDGIDVRIPATLLSAVDWRKRVSQGTWKGYLGNAVVIPFTQFPVDDVINAGHLCPDKIDSINDTLAYLACSIQRAIDSVDDTFVASRTKAMAVFKNDPRRFGMGFDSRVPTCIGFNTWRHLSSDANWSIPGVPVSRADAVRRVGPKVGADKSLILPMGSDEGEQKGIIEMLVWLTEDAMQNFLHDEGFMCWVDHVIG